MTLAPPNQRAQVVHEALPTVLEARRRGLMHVTLEGRDGKTVTLPGGKRVREFINCSYLALDQHPRVIARGKELLDQWGVHFCSARTRFSIGPNRDLEDALGDFFGGRVVTFPSVTTTHLSVLPLLASGALWPDERHSRLIFDRFAHSSMGSLKPLLRESARVETIEHNDLDALETQFKAAAEAGERPVYVADSVYSMGGRCPIRAVLELAERYDAKLYLDDAHGTSIYGPRGEGAIIEAVGPGHPRIISTFSLSKGFGTNGGGVIVSSVSEEELIRCFGLTYAFSGSLDFSVMGAAMASLELHLDGTVTALQKTLQERVSFFDRQLGVAAPHFSPIRMVTRRSIQHALDTGEQLIERGFFVSVVMFPVVPREMPQLRVCLSVAHTEGDLAGLGAALHELA